MPNNYLLPGSTFTREVSFHIAGHVFADFVFSLPEVPWMWDLAQIEVGRTGASHAIAEVVTAMSFEIDSAVARASTDLDILSEHLGYIESRDICPEPETRSTARPLTNSNEWVDHAGLTLLQHHWWGISTLAEILNKGFPVPSDVLTVMLLSDDRCSPYAWERTTICLDTGIVEYP